VVREWRAWYHRSLWTVGDLVREVDAWEAQQPRQKPGLSVALNDGANLAWAWPRFPATQEPLKLRAESG
jgi:hypothetical protein